MLPDREKRHLLQFHVAPRLPYGPRLAAAVSLMVCAVSLQIVMAEPVVAAVVGGGLIFAGNLFLLVKGYDLQPRGSRGDADWVRTTLDRFREVKKREASVKKWDETFVDITCASGAASLLLMVALPTAFVCLVLAASLDDGRDLAIVFAVDVAALFLPHWVTGVRRKWRPVGLSERIDSLTAALDALGTYSSPPCQVQPMFLMSGEGEGQVPVDARVFIRFPDGPEDFLGLQLQVAINNVQGTRYPYLYAVLVARESYGLIEKHEREIEAMTDLTVETSRDPEEGVDALVIRQPTTKDSGYHTGRGAVKDIARAGWEAACIALGAPVRR